MFSGWEKAWFGDLTPYDPAMNDPVALSLRQFVGAWRHLCTPGPGHVLAVEGPLEYAFSGLPIAFFNVAFVTPRFVTAAELAEAARRAIDWGGNRRVPWMLVVTEEALEPGTDATAVLDGCGLVPVMVLTGMIAPVVPKAARLPEGLKLEQPRDDAGCQKILDVNAAAYGMDMSSASAVLGRASFWNDHLPVVGRVEGGAVCCAATLLVDGHRYVAWVATEPAHQRKGYADAAMRRSLELAAEEYGEVPSVLHATAAGLPIYERMGYRTIATHPIFMERRFLAR